MKLAWLYVSAQDLAGDLSIQPRVQQLLDQAEQLPLRAGYRYNEPDSLEAIRANRPDGPRVLNASFSPEALFDHIYGAWLGRCCGCLLGKPVEGWRSYKLWPYLRDLNAYPLSDYFRSDAPEAVRARYNVTADAAYTDRVAHMVEDDDTNYTVTILAVFKTYGSGLSPEDVATFWMNNIPIMHT